MRKRCGAVLHYEQFQGMRLFITEGRKKIYRYWCPGCKTYGENNSKPSLCYSIKDLPPTQAKGRNE